MELSEHKQIPLEQTGPYKGADMKHLGYSLTAAGIRKVAVLASNDFDPRPKGPQVIDLIHIETETHDISVSEVVGGTMIKYSQEEQKRSGMIGEYVVVRPNRLDTTRRAEGGDRVTKYFLFKDGTLNTHSWSTEQGSKAINRGSQQFHDSNTIMFGAVNFNRLRLITVRNKQEPLYKP